MADALFTRFAISLAGTPRFRRPKPMFSSHRHVRIERIGLEHHGDVAFARLGIGDIALADENVALRVTSSSPASMRSVVDLPHPEGPTSTRNSPSSTVEIEVAHDGDVAIALPDMIEHGHATF